MFRRVGVAEAFRVTFGIAQGYTILSQSCGLQNALTSSGERTSAESSRLPHPSVPSSRFLVAEGGISDRPCLPCANGGGHRSNINAGDSAEGDVLDHATPATARFDGWADLHLSDPDVLERCIGHACLQNAMTSSAARTSAEAVGSRLQHRGVTGGLLPPRPAPPPLLTYA